MHVVSWHSLPHATPQEKISATLSTAYVNLPLAIVFANSFFGPVVALMVVLYDIPWNLMLIPYKMYLDRKEKRAESLTATKSASEVIFVEEKKSKLAEV